MKKDSQVVYKRHIFHSLNAPERPHGISFIEIVSPAVPRKETKVEDLLTASISTIQSASPNSGVYSEQEVLVPARYASLDHLLDSREKSRILKKDLHQKTQIDFDEARSAAKAANQSTDVKSVD